VQLRPDHKLVYRRDWSDLHKRMKGVRLFMRKLAGIAEAAGNAAG
jgi:transcription-repair coupling factor (superfamily II helicase)